MVWCQRGREITLRCVCEHCLGGIDGALWELDCSLAGCGTATDKREGQVVYIIEHSGFCRGRPQRGGSKVHISKTENRNAST